MNSTKRALRNTKVDLASKVGVFSLSLLTAAAAMYIYSPIIGSHAEDSADLEVEVNVGGIVGMRINTDTLNLNGSVGTFTSSNVNVDITSNSRYGYTLSIEDKDNDSSMVSSVVDNVVTSNFSESKTSATMPNNSWGYSTDNVDFYSVPVNGSPVAIKRTNSKMVSAFETTPVYFGVKVGMNLPATTYEDTVVFTAYVNGAPEPEDDLNDITTMQEMTPAIVANTAEGVSKTLIDDRNYSNNTYTVTKLADGNIWMTQNLRISNVEVSSDDSDMQEGRTFTITEATKENFQTYEVKVYSPDIDVSRAYVDNAEGGYGGYYNFYTATAGTGGDVVTFGAASDSICPKGWKMPSRSELGTLTNYYGPTRLVQENPKFDLSGDVSGGDLWLKETAGWYWTTEIYDNDDAYRLVLNIDNINLSGSTDKSYGLSVRCVARS